MANAGEAVLGPISPLAGGSRRLFEKNKGQRFNSLPLILLKEEDEFYSILRVARAFVRDRFPHIAKNIAIDPFSLDLQVKRRIIMFSCRYLVQKWELSGQD